MSPLPLPTDNLYKFCALSGLAMIVISLYASWSISNELFKLVNQQTLAMKRADLESEFVNHRFDATKRSHADLLYNQKHHDLIAQGKEPEVVPEVPGQLRVPMTPADLDKELREEIEISKRILLDKTDISAHLVEISWLDNERTLVRWFAAAGILGGIGLSWYGFKNWRVLQLHQDKLFLARQVELTSVVK